MGPGTSTAMLPDTTVWFLRGGGLGGSMAADGHRGGALPGGGRARAGVGLVGAEDRTGQPAPGQRRRLGDSTLAGGQADAYTRARVALEGLLALGRDETMITWPAPTIAGRRCIPAAPTVSRGCRRRPAGGVSRPTPTIFPVRCAQPAIQPERPNRPPGRTGPVRVEHGPGAAAGNSLAAHAGQPRCRAHLGFITRPPGCRRHPQGNWLRRPSARSVRVHDERAVPARRVRGMPAMKRPGNRTRLWFYRGLTLLATAVIVHLLAVWALPRLIMQRLMHGPAVRGSTPTGVPGIRPRSTPRRAKWSCPARTCCMRCASTTCRGRLCESPRAGPGHLLVDRALRGQQRQLFVISSRPGQPGCRRYLAGIGRRQYFGSPPVPAGAQVVVSPSKEGFLLMRVLTSDYASGAAVLEPARRSLACTPAAR